MLKLAEVSWESGGLLFTCPECGGETLVNYLCPNLRCCHCETVYKLPSQLTVKPIKEKSGMAIAEGS